MRKTNQKLWDGLLNQLKDFNIQAGWFENTKYDDATPVAGIAAVQNFGAHIKVSEKQRNYLRLLGLYLNKNTSEIVIPSRPFYDNAKKRINGLEGKKIVMQEIFRVINGFQTMEQAAERIGHWMQGVIQEENKKINTPPLSEATIELRNSRYNTRSKNKSTKPLNSSGIMFATVQSKVSIK